jgi:hypothetical protein
MGGGVRMSTDVDPSTPFRPVDAPIDASSPLATQASVDEVNAKLDALMLAHNEMVEKVNGLITSVEPHLADLGPLIDAIASNPVFRMFTGGKKPPKPVNPDPNTYRKVAP